MIKMSEYQTLIGQDVQISQNQFSASTSIDFSPPEPQGLRITGAQFKFAFAGAGGGAALHPSGTLFFFRADPSISAGTASNGLTVAQMDMIIGKLEVAEGDWETLAANLAEMATFGAMWVGSSAEVMRVPGFPTLYLAFLYTGATQINSLAGDQEVLSIRLFNE